ncbi:MAG: Activator of Hsp90 ATPase 1 family protein [Subtercola sp.]|nr:Activator of Hsp90 ATPase 1 family protein [Subtercola sp.]
MAEVIEPLRISFDVACPAAHAFRIWTDRIDTWWPRDHTATNDAESVIRLEKRVGGRLFEVTPDGEEHLWGTVTVWQPSNRFGYDWHIRRDAADATDVQISFVSHGESTTVQIVHSGWERLGANGPTWKDLNRGGWNGVLPQYIAEAEKSSAG